MAFLKLFARNEMIWPFRQLLNVKENRIFWPVLEKCHTYQKFCFLTLKKFGLYLAFLLLRIWSFSKLLTAKFGFKIFFDQTTLRFEASFEKGICYETIFMQTVMKLYFYESEIIFFAKPFIMSNSVMK